MNKSTLFLPFCFVWFLFAQEEADDLKLFITSFVDHYDITPQGRYTHEYHPFLLKQARSSCHQFEQAIIDNGFCMVGRHIIMGYQQQGIPSYCSDMNEEVIQDEVSLKKAFGRVVPAKNIFGFLSGFLFKDCTWLHKNWFSQTDACIEHICVDTVDLFKDSYHLLHEHAFGQDIHTILEYRDRIERCIHKQDVKGCFQHLIDFWSIAYQGALTSCSYEALATQDILFSIEHAQTILNSLLPLKKWYIGPDITYPIELLPDQKQGVTACAQRFVEQFDRTLIAYEKEKTVYVFTSFVDGVGKSTLLGNLINWSKYGTNIEQYERVDNSSSQKGVLYQLRDDVFILDLPSQMSHFVSKPDGHVFVEMELVCELGEQDIRAVRSYVCDNHKELKHYFEDRMHYSTEILKQDDLYDMYVEAIKAFDVKKRWIPFWWQERLYIFDFHNHTHVRVLVPLEGVHSRGLKVIQPDQMLFTQGISIPMRFNTFIDDVIQKLNKAGIKHVVMVDFLSMYPRTSRENIRINFLLHYLKKFYSNEFDIEKSFYRTFVYHGPEVCHLLKTSYERIYQALCLETYVRAALYQIFCNYAHKDILPVDIHTMQKIMSSYIKNIEHTHGSIVKDSVKQKLQNEKKIFSKYFFDKRCEVFLQFDWNLVIKFSDFMHRLHTQMIDNDHVRRLWSLPRQSIVQVEKECRDQIELGVLIKTLRAHWYGSLTNLLDAAMYDDGTIQIESSRYAFPACTVCEHNETTIQVEQVLFDHVECDESYMHKHSHMLSLFNNHHALLNKSVLWGILDDEAYCLSWQQAMDTSYGLYAFGYGFYGDLSISRSVDNYFDVMEGRGYANIYMRTSRLWKYYEQREDQRCKKTLENHLKKVIVDSPHGRAISLWVRSIATLEMIARDENALFLARAGNREDFIALLKLLEHVTLPTYFGIVFDKPLFDDYAAVEKVI